MPTTHRTWDIKFKAAAEGLPEKLLSQLVRKIVFLILGASVQLGAGGVSTRGVIRLTPVDRGGARLGWTVQVGSPDMRAPTSGAHLSPSAITGRMRGYKPFDVVFVVNPLPYAPVLEEGGYPDPPKKGSWDRKRKRFVIKSRGGFSKQGGNMLAVTLIAIRQGLR